MIRHTRTSKPKQSTNSRTGFTAEYPSWRTKKTASITVNVLLFDVYSRARRYSPHSFLRFNFCYSAFGCIVAGVSEWKTAKLVASFTVIFGKKYSLKMTVRRKYVLKRTPKIDDFGLPNMLMDSEKVYRYNDLVTDERSCRWRNCYHILK